MHKIIAALAFLVVASPALAVECVDLKPAPPKNETSTFTGKMDASVDGFFAKLASVGTQVEGTYSQVATHVLAELPSADKLYMWERVLFLECQLLRDAKDVSSKEKLQMVGELYQKFGSAPPDIVPPGSGPVMNNSGNNSQLIQGSGNSINNTNK
jgi:hypothetical protein